MVYVLHDYYFWKYVIVSVIIQSVAKYLSNEIIESLLLLRSKLIEIMINLFSDFLKWHCCIKRFEII